MVFFRKIRAKTSGAHFLVLDVGTDVVKAMICEAEGDKGRILGVGHKQQKLGDMNSAMVNDIASVANNCQIAIREAEKMAGVHAQQMIMGISGDMVKGATNTINFVRREANKKIDLTEFKNIVHKVQWRAFELIRSQIAQETGYNEIDIKLVNASIEEVRIDGYKIKNPIGFQGKDVTVTIFNAFAPLAQFGTLQTIAAEMDRELLAVAAEPYTLARSMSFEDRGNFGAIFIDVGAGVTDISIVSDGAVVGTKMFSLGGRIFSKRLSQSLNISYTEAEAIKKAYSNDKLERQSHRIVRESLQSDCDIWLSGVVLTLESLTGVSSLPPKILLSGGGANLPEIKEALETRDWSKSLPFDKKPQVNIFHPKMITNLVDETKALNDQQYVMPMALANFGLEYVGEETLPAKVLKKVVRLMQI